MRPPMAVSMSRSPGGHLLDTSHISNLPSCWYVPSLSLLTRPHLTRSISVWSPVRTSPNCAMKSTRFCTNVRRKFEPYSTSFLFCKPPATSPNHQSARHRHEMPKYSPDDIRARDL